jgi:hypothetical protein
MRRLGVRIKPRRGLGWRRTPPACVRLGYERKVDDTAYMRARDGSETREKKGEAGLRLASWAGPLRGASEWRRARLRRLAWAKEELGQRLQPSGPKARDERRKRFSIFFLF